MTLNIPLHVRELCRLMACARMRSGPESTPLDDDNHQPLDLALIPAVNSQIECRSFEHHTARPGLFKPSQPRCPPAHACVFTCPPQSKNLLATTSPPPHYNLGYRSLASSAIGVIVAVVYHARHRCFVSFPSAREPLASGVRHSEWAIPAHTPHALLDGPSDRIRARNTNRTLLRFPKMLDERGNHSTAMSMPNGVSENDQIDGSDGSSGQCRLATPGSPSTAKVLFASALLNQRGGSCILVILLSLVLLGGLDVASSL